MPPKVLLN